MIAGGNAVVVQLWNVKRKKSTQVQKFIPLKGRYSVTQKDFWAEVDAQQKFAKASLAPRIIDAAIVTPEMASITMERITGTLENGHALEQRRIH